MVGIIIAALPFAFHSGIFTYPLIFVLLTIEKNMTEIINTSRGISL